MKFKDSGKTELKILIIFIVISAILAVSILAVGYFQENRFEKIVRKNAIEKYELLLTDSINNVLNKLSEEAILYAKKEKCSKIPTKKTSGFKPDYILIYNLSSFSCGISQTGKQIHNNIIGFIPKKDVSGIFKNKNKLYFYSSHTTHNTTIVVLKNFLSALPLSKIGKIKLQKPTAHYKIKKINNIKMGVYSKGKNEYLVLFDIFNKPAATVSIIPDISAVFEAHYKTILHILIFTLIAVLISGLLSYYIIKNTVLDDINSMIESIKNIRLDFTYSPPAFKNAQFQALALTLEWLIKRIKESEYLFNKITDFIPVGIIVYKNTPIFANRYAREFFGQDIVGIPLADFVKEKHRKMLLNIKSKRIEGDDFNATYTIGLKTPQDKIIRISSSTIKYKGGFAGLMVFMDVTKNERARTLYKMLNAVNDVIVRAANEKELLKDVCLGLSSIEEINYIWVSEKETGKSIFSFGNPNTKEQPSFNLLNETADKAIIKNSSDTSTVVIPISVNRKLTYILGIQSNVENFFDYHNKSIVSQIKINIGLAIERIRIHKERTYMLFYDPLTNLKNFNSLKNDINSISSCTLIYMNIRDFSVINQIYGFEFSDRILKNIGVVLRKNTKSTDNVYRLHGDKFAVLIKSGLSKQNIEQLISRLKTILLSFEIDKRKIPIHTDIGVTLFPDLINSKEKIIESVEVALTKSKNTKEVCFYSDDLQKDIQENFNLETYMRTAIEKRLFFFYYQPILNLKLNRIDKAEALIRLKDENDNMLNPEKFISTAEKVNIISDLSKIVIEKVFSQIREIQGIDISINLSSKDIENREILSLIENSIEKSGLKLRKISIELTERDVMHNFQKTKRFIEKLRELNIEIEIDDFGIGYSSFDRIVDLDFDVLKIDKSLVDKIGLNKKAEEIVVYIIKLAHSLKAKALAEGIEKKNQLDFLRKNDCDYIQGYFISKPLPFDEFKRFIDNTKNGFFSK